MIVGVRNQRIKTHAPEKFGGVFPGFDADPPQFFGERDIRPFFSRAVRVLGAQHRQGADHAGAAIAFRRFLAIKAFDEQDVFAANVGQLALRRRQEST